MSRLDDELRQAFRREEPSPDFTARVMKAVATAPAPKRRWWNELLSLLTTPKARWVTVGAAVSLLAVVLATQYNRLEQAPPGDKAATKVQQPEPATTGDQSKDTSLAMNKFQAPERLIKQVVKDALPRHHHRTRNQTHARPQRPEVAKSEGEIAKDQIMLALHIASASLNEAQKIVRSAEGHQPRTIAR